MNLAATDERWMRLALTLGQRGLGQVWPNPAVGCVLVNNGRVVGRGWTQRGGRPHAEIHALSQAGDAAKGATAYVTLEPCAHTGKSGPCALALAKAGVKRVVSAITDPNPKVAGKGHEILRAAGIDVVENLLSDQAAKAHAGFFSLISRSRPLVTLKLASSLDGRIASAIGHSKWITGAHSRKFVHMMRANHDAILVGRQTAMADDPELTVRGVGLNDRSPVRVVLDTKMQMPNDLKLCKTAKATPTWVCTAAPNSENADLWAQDGAQILPCNAAKFGLDMTDVLGKLAAKGITRLMVEGGGAIAGSLMGQGLVDRLVLFNGPIIIGADGLPSLAPFGVKTLETAPRFELETVQAIGNDTVSHWSAC